MSEKNQVTSEEKKSYRGDYHEQWSHVERVLLIRSTEKYIVVLDLIENIDWETSTIYDEEMKGWSNDERLVHNNLLAEIAVLEVSINGDFPSTVKRHFKRLLGEALAHSFTKDVETAKKIIEAAIQYLRLRNEETSRRWYLTSSAICSSIFIVLGIAIWACREFFFVMLGANAFWILMSCCAGALGTLLSVIVRSGDIKVDAGAGKSLHYLEGGSRVVAGAISAVIVVMAVRSNMIFGAFSEGGHLNLITMLAAVAAGSGERLATSIISKFDDTNANIRNENNQETVKV